MARDSEYDLVTKLTDILTDNDVEDFEVHTFEDAGLLTGNTGLVLRDKDGQEFQVQVVQAR